MRCVSRLNVFLFIPESVIPRACSESQPKVYWRCAVMWRRRASRPWRSRFRCAGGHRDRRTGQAPGRPSCRRAPFPGRAPTAPVRRDRALSLTRISCPRIAFFVRARRGGRPRRVRCVRACPPGMCGAPGQVHVEVRAHDRPRCVDFGVFVHRAPAVLRGLVAPLPRPPEPARAGPPRPCRQSIRFGRVTHTLPLLVPARLSSSRLCRPSAGMSESSAMFAHPSSPPRASQSRPAAARVSPPQLVEPSASFASSSPLPPPRLPPRGLRHARSPGIVRERAANAFCAMCPPTPASLWPARLLRKRCGDRPQRPCVQCRAQV